MKRQANCTSLARPARGGALFALALVALVFGTPFAAQAETRFNFQTPGADDDLRKALRNASLVVAARRDNKEDTIDLFSAARADYARLLGTLYGAGRYSGVISITLDGREAASIAPLDLPAEIGEITIIVQPGPLFRFSRATITPLAKGTELPERFHPNGRAYSGAITEAADAGVEGWRALGHAKAAVSGQSLTADHANATVSADIRLEPGPVARFGKFRFAGNQRTRDHRIAEIAGFPSGERFDPEKLDTVANRLRRTGVFSSVTLTEADQFGPGTTLDISADLVEQKRRRLGFGAEVSSFDGLELTGYWLHRNLMGGAERLRIEGSASNIGGKSSGIDYTLGARFDRPATFFPDAGLFLETSIESLDEQYYRSENVSVAGGMSYIFNDRLSAQAGLSLRYSRVLDPEGVTEYQLVSLPLELTWDNRDDKVDATTGAYLSAGFEPFAGFGDTGNGARMTFDGRAYRAFDDSGRFVLAGRAQIGMIYGADIRAVPPDFLFYSGGGGTVRGQPYQSLGVTVTGPRIQSGGRSFMAYSGELRARVGESFGLAAFYDTGYVSSAELFDGSGEWHAGAGIGLRYYTGIGPIRLDVATPTSGSTGDGVQLYIGIGQSF